MKLSRFGKPISEVEMNTTPFGVWLLCHDHEYFLSYEQFPWFKDATLSALYNIELLHNSHLYWPELDIDLHLDALAHRDKYPLIYLDPKGM